MISPFATVVSDMEQYEETHNQQETCPISRRVHDDGLPPSFLVLSICRGSTAGCSLQYWQLEVSPCALRMGIRVNQISQCHCSTGSVLLLLFFRTETLGEMQLVIAYWHFSQRWQIHRWCWACYSYCCTSRHSKVILGPALCQAAIGLLSYLANPATWTAHEAVLKASKIDGFVYFLK